MKNENLVPKVRFKGFSDPWEQRKLGELGKIQGGGTPDSGIAEYWDGNVNWFTPTEVSNNGYLESSNRKITSLGLKKSSARLMPASTVLITSRAGVGRMGILKYPASTNQGFQSLILNSATDEYFIYSMQPIISKLANRLASGSTFTEISGKQMEKIEIMIPTTGEQNRISSLMKCINNLIAANEDKLEQLKTLKKLMMQKIFSQEWRFKGFTDPWEQRKLGDISKITAGGDIDKDKLSTRGRYPVIANALTNNGVVGYYDSYKVKGPAVTVTGRGDVGHAKTRIESFTPIVRLLVVSAPNFDINFLENAINNIRIFNESTGVPQLTAPQLGSYEFEYPCSSEQVCIGNVLHKIDNLIAANEDKLNQLKELKKYLMQNMFV
ncbi:restriction endonuclease subunit S [Lactiplantibacillus plantarum]|uniref:Type I restriction-modification system,specificity subunit n=1 Tax=Lactiplantibacillus plantarum (strain ATCC BAA-793 / NCIMB 8826 / WCFS1) TaxID=220668 RepID=F9UMD7_LACPL|nr:restriction endonuclease subunit S [Lactiplantibacillus plantarum]ALF13635.1 type I restriction endonuclease [Lactiplantibacillus plantarum]MDE4414415.1 restriction endonuclease subunit S [Lactiplantibacillus plantarum]MDE4418099.1 restriction endonuclease subunit S [Lactiplantibacillus plantarum]MDE4419770.1 restriction endonuclease subunit S [Lactiplantibacillus plantarum]MDE4425223.1 restriction endonuclease subunit S [Lactiplantibacillus plantarum]